VATETWSHEEVCIVIWAIHVPSRNLLPFDGDVLYCDDCMSKFGVDCEDGRTNVHNRTSRFSTKDGCEHSTSGGTDFGKPTSHNLRFIRFTEGICNIVHEEPWCCLGYEHCAEVLDGRAQKPKFRDDCFRCSTV
jgi:hypothetical protein